MFDDQREEQENQFPGEMSAQQSESPVAPIENSNQEENLVLKWMINVPESNAHVPAEISTEVEMTSDDEDVADANSETSFEWDMTAESTNEFSDLNAVQESEEVELSSDFIVEEQHIEEPVSDFVAETEIGSTDFDAVASSFWNETEVVNEIESNQEIVVAENEFGDFTSETELVAEESELVLENTTEEFVASSTEEFVAESEELSELPETLTIESKDDLVVKIEEIESIPFVASAESVTGIFSEAVVAESDIVSEEVVNEIAAGVHTTIAPVDLSWMNAEENVEQPVAEIQLESEATATDLPWNEPHLTHNTNTQSEEAMKFDIPEHSSIIKVIGVGGGGSNAVNHMYRMGIRGVDFVVCNTDKQALDMSPIPHKITLGATLTEGRGAGSIPDVGRNAAIENIEDIRSILANNTKMVFITAGMGGGTGTGAAPVIAGIAREMGILTVAIVTVPFGFEGKKRRQQAEEGLEQLKQSVDTLLVICNDKLREMYGNLKLSDAFGHADDVLSTAAKSIAEIISLTQQINVDFADVCTVMRDSGVAIMGSATASGENRAVRAVEESLNSPLLNDNNITGARYVLLNIVSGAEEITMDELGEITDYIQEAAGMTAEIIKGYGVDESLGDSVSVTIIATGFNSSNPVSYEYSKTPQNEKVVRQLDEQKVVQQSTPVKNEFKPEAVNELEPFLISRTEETPRQSTIEFEITNNTPVVNEESKSEEIISSEISNEPFLLKTEEVVESVSETPVAQEEIVAEEEEIKLITHELVTPIAQVSNEEQAKKVAAEEQLKKAQERISKLKEISLKLKTTQGLSEMENEPAYKRRNIELDNTPHSSESQVSRFTLTETEDKKIEIRPNNSFLHDNVD